MGLMHTMVSKFKQRLLYAVIFLCGSLPLSCELDSSITIDIEDIKQNKKIIGIDLYMDLPVVGAHTFRQGCAYYQNNLFVFHNTNDIVEVYDFKNKSLISVMDMTLFDLNHMEFHCNNANFSAYKYDDSDFFPLLYVSMENLNQRKILVLRISAEGSKYNFEQIQTIQLPNNLYYTNSYLDTDNDALWVSGYTTDNFNASSNNKLDYIMFNLPNYKGEKMVVLGNNDIVQKSEFDSISSTQGGQINNGFLYQVFGVYPPLYLKVFDLQRSMESYSCAISDYNPAEPEGLFIVEDDIYYSTESHIYIIRFE